LLKRKQSKNTSKIKFSRFDEDKLQEIKKILTEQKLITSSLRIKVTETIKKRFLNLGYDVQIKLLNGADYGVPQKRQRVIILGGLEGYPISFPSPLYSEKIKNASSVLPAWLTVKQAIDDLKNMPENIRFNHIFTKCGKDFQKKN